LAFMNCLQYGIITRFPKSWEALAGLSVNRHTRDQVFSSQRKIHRDGLRNLMADLGSQIPSRRGVRELMNHRPPAKPEVDDSP
jgi:hypothetical protein